MILGMAKVLSYYMIDQQIPQRFSEWIAMHFSLHDVLLIAVADDTRDERRKGGTRNTHSWNEIKVGANGKKGEEQGYEKRPIIVSGELNQDTSEHQGSRNEFGQTQKQDHIAPFRECLTVGKNGVNVVHVYPDEQENEPRGHQLMERDLLVELVRFLKIPVFQCVSGQRSGNGRDRTRRHVDDVSHVKGDGVDASTIEALQRGKHENVELRHDIARDDRQQQEAGISKELVTEVFRNERRVVFQRDG